MSTGSGMNTHDTAVVLSPQMLQEMYRSAGTFDPTGGQELIVVVPRESARAWADDVEEMVERVRRTARERRTTPGEVVATCLMGLGYASVLAIFAGTGLHPHAWHGHLTGLVILAVVMLAAYRITVRQRGRESTHLTARAEVGRLLEELHTDVTSTSRQLASLRVPPHHARDLAEQITPQVHHQMLQHSQHAQEVLQVLHRRQVHAEREREQQVAWDVLTTARTSRAT